MFKSFRDGMRVAQVNKAMGIAASAITAERMDVADEQLEKAYKLCLETKFPRSNHIEIITFWGLLGMSIRKRGFPELADHCKNMSSLLQARFDAGDYYPD